MIKARLNPQKLILFAIAVVLLTAMPAIAQQAFDSGLALPKVDVDFGEMQQKAPLARSLQLMLYLTSLSLIPYVFISCTAFIRISIILSFLKSNIGLSHGIPKQVWAGIAMILTFFVMAPVFAKADVGAFQPYIHKQVGYEEFMGKMRVTLMDFMKKNTRVNDLKLFISLSKPKNPQKLLEKPPFFPLLAAFMISEMKTGFYVGFVIYLPFLAIDMIVASTLMSMGMFMLSPMGFSTPCKMLCFTMIDGFNLLIEGLIRTYHY